MADDIAAGFVRVVDAAAAMVAAAATRHLDSLERCSFLEEASPSADRSSYLTCLEMGKIGAEGLQTDPCGDWKVQTVLARRVRDARLGNPWRKKGTHPDLADRSTYFLEGAERQGLVVVLLSARH